MNYEEMYSKLLFFAVLLASSSAFHLSEKYRAKAWNYRQRFLVIHYTVSNFTNSLQALTGNRVSSHYLVPDDSNAGPGNKRVIYRLVPEHLRAWTQGLSDWRNRKNLNDNAISIEIVNAGWKKDKYGRRVFADFSQAQINDVIALAKDIVTRYKISPINVIGHSDCAPMRKQDPGPKFPWQQLYDNGIGAWPDQKDVEFFKRTVSKLSVLDVQKDLARYGYKVNVDGHFTEQTKSVVSAFQMHFRNTNYAGSIDIETVAILKALIKKYR